MALRGLLAERSVGRVMVEPQGSAHARNHPYKPHTNPFASGGQDYPLNLSISFSGGKETKKDSLSNGE